MSLIEIVRRDGKEYSVVKRLDEGDLHKAGSGTSRWKVFFQVNKPGNERLVRAWRGKTFEYTKRRLEAHYRKKGYAISVESSEYINGSFKD